MMTDWHFGQESRMGRTQSLACFSDKGPTEVVSVLRGLRSQMESGTQSSCWKMCLHFSFQIGPEREHHFIQILVQPVQKIELLCFQTPQLDLEYSCF